MLMMKQIHSQCHSLVRHHIVHFNKYLHIYLVFSLQLLRFISEFFSSNQELLQLYTSLFKRATTSVHGLSCFIYFIHLVSDPFHILNNNSNSSSSSSYTGRQIHLPFTVELNQFRFTCNACMHEFSLSFSLSHTHTHTCTAAFLSVCTLS